MKTAISVPDELFTRAERFAKQTKKSRSQLFSDALRDYLARHASDEVTQAMDRVCATLHAETADPFVSMASERILRRSDW